MKKHVIYSNYNLNDYWDDVVEYLKDMHTELEPEDIDWEPSDGEIWDEIYFQSDIEWDEVKYSLEHFFGNEPIIMTGMCETWMGHTPGGKIGTFLDLFYSIMKDCDYFEFYDEGGHLYLECSHHDGTHHVEFRKLSPKGIQFYNNHYEQDYSRKECCEKAMNSNFLSKLPKYWDYINNTI